MMDLLDGVVVHAKRGERAKYMPVHLSSSVVSSSEPLRVIEAVNPSEVYIADLNRLMGTGTCIESLRAIRSRYRDIRIALDYGIKSPSDMEEIACVADSIILGTETASLELIHDTAANYPITVSIDLFHRKVRASDVRMKIEPLRLIEELDGYPVESIIILELDRVGTNSGVDTDFIARCVEHSSHDILCGGGVRNYEDIYKLEAIGVKGALVATAVHEGAITVSGLRTGAGEANTGG